MAIRKKTKFLVRFFLSKDAPSYRKDIEYCGKDMWSCMSKLRQNLHQYIKSYTVYVDGEKTRNFKMKVHGRPQSGA